MFDFFKRKSSKNIPEKKAVETEFKVEQISQFLPFSELSEQYCILAHDFIELVTFKKNQLFISLDETDEFDYFLLKGNISLTAADDKQIQFDQDSDKANKAIAILRPRRFNARVESDSAMLLRIPHHILSIVIETVNNFHEEQSRSEVIEGYAEEGHLFKKIEHELERESLVLPSWPDIALKVSQACESEDADLAYIAEIAASDVSIATKLMKASNSAFYRGAQPIKNLQQAVTRLGQYTTKNLVTFYAAKELFSSNVPEIDELYHKVFQRSLEVAVLSKTIVSQMELPLDPDSAFLAGLLHKVGYLPVYLYAADYMNDMEDFEHIVDVAEQHNAAIGSLICKTWNLDPIYRFVLEHSSDWTYHNEREQVDYAEVVIAAQIHYAIKTKATANLPPFTSVPALSHIFASDFGPDKSVQVLLHSEKELALYAAA